MFVFEDDFPLNGEQDGGGGVDVLSPSEPGLGGFNITLFDDAGGTGDATGQMTYDMFNYAACRTVWREPSIRRPDSTRARSRRPITRNQGFDGDGESRPASPARS